MEGCQLGVCARMTERGREGGQRGTSIFNSLEINIRRPIIWAVPVTSTGEIPQDREMDCMQWTAGEIPGPPSERVPQTNMKGLD